MTVEQGAARPLPRGRSRAETQELPDYCARPSCRRGFTRVLGPGRPQAFCSEVCRRAAEKELRQARSRLAHFEELTAQLRVDIAAFGRGGLPGADDHSSTGAGGDAVRVTAVNAVHRTAGVLAFLGDSDDPLAKELRSLHTAVAPALLDPQALDPPS